MILLGLPLPTKLGCCGQAFLDRNGDEAIDVLSLRNMEVRIL